MVEKILRINHKDVMAPTDPVTRKMAKDTKNMYPKYSMYVMSMRDASKLRNQKMEYTNV
jgi:hypothetical protein